MRPVQAPPPLLGHREQLQRHREAPTWSRDIGYGYDSLFRLNYLRHQGGQAASLTYTPEHLPSAVKLPVTVSGTTKLTETFTYTPAHRPQALVYNGGAVDVALGRRYSYDALGRLASVTRGQPPGNPDLLQDEVQRSFRYDAVGRLSHYDDVHHWQEDGGIVCPDPFDLTTCYRDVIPHADLLRAQDFSYDAVGNRTDLGAVLEPGNRLTSFNGTTLGYDADGNLTSKTKPGFTQTLSWNTRGQLVSVTTNGVTTTFGYDGFGRRVRKTTGATTTRSLWDGDDLVLELDGAGTPVREYSAYPGIDHPFAVRRASDGALFYYAQELPGHVAGLINSADQVVNTYEYDPWGQALGTTEPVPQPLEYGGREYDSETGFYYNRARYYDPQLGRFISEDPIGLAGGINPFAYVGNDPVNFRDPTGTCPAGTIQVDAFHVETEDGHVIHVRVCASASGFTLPPVTVEAPKWPFLTPRDQGWNASPSARGPDHYTWQPQPPFPGGGGGGQQPQQLSCPGPLGQAGVQSILEQGLRRQAATGLEQGGYMFRTSQGKLYGVFELDPPLQTWGTFGFPYPYPRGTVATWHTHPSGPGVRQAPSPQDLWLAAKRGIDVFIASPDSFFYKPVGGALSACSRR